MRKFLSPIVLCLTLMFCGFNATAQSKAYRKMVKQKIKEFKKEDYKEIVGSSYTIEYALEKFYSQLATDKYTEMEIVVENCPTEGLCKKKMLTDAAIEYSTLSNSYLKGRINAEGGFDAIASKGGLDDLAKDRFYGAYEQRLASKLNGIITPSFTVKKTLKNDKYKYKSFFLIEKESARRQRMLALQQAQAETNANIEWGTSISNFVNEDPATN